MLSNSQVEGTLLVMISIKPIYQVGIFSMKCKSGAGGSRPDLFARYMWRYESSFLIYVDGSYLGEKDKRAGWTYICFNSNGTLNFADFGAIHCCSVQESQLGPFTSRVNSRILMSRLDPT